MFHCDRHNVGHTLNLQKKPLLFLGVFWSAVVLEMVAPILWADSNQIDTKIKHHWQVVQGNAARMEGMTAVC